MIYIRSIFISLSLFISFNVYPQTADSFFSGDMLLKDFNVLKSALLTFHPGLYRYQDSLTVSNHFNNLENQLRNGLTLKESYLAFSALTAKLMCGHTFCSYYNQNNEVKKALFEGVDKLPFTFVLYRKRMFVDKSVAPDQNLKEKSEVISINGVPVSLILDSLLLLTKGDGKNDGKRLHSLQLSGLSNYEPFDVYYPLAFPNESNNFILEVVNEGSADVLRITVPAVSRRNRLELIEQKYGKQPSTDDDLWQFKIIDKNSAYLKIGTFVLRNLSFDYEDFIKDAFEQIVDLKISNLILDIRGNEGGMDEVNFLLAGFLSSKPLSLPKYRDLLVYSKAPDSLRPYISTWDDDFYDRTDDVIRVDNRFFTWKEEQEETFSSPFPENKRFSGRLWILVDEANSSATFFLAQAAKENSLGTLVGTQTGGNRMGTNGGQLFFLRLPNSQIEVDLPLIGYYPQTPQPNEGIMPDIEIKKTLSDLLSNRDTVLEHVLKLIED